MPIISNVTTKRANLSWTSPDKKINLYDLILLADGKQIATKTYSAQIAKEGWTGDVETYQKPGRDGTTNTFIKQVKKEESTYTKGNSKASSNDLYTMYLSYAKDLAIALVDTTGFDVDSFNKLLEQVNEGGKFLYDHRPGAEPIKEDTVVPVDGIKVDTYD